MRVFFILLLVSTLLIGCGRFAPGFMVTDEGNTIANNDENNRQLTVDCIRKQLDAQLGGHWRTVVTLPELPVYEESVAELRGANREWMWATATVTVELVGDGSAPLPFTEEALRQVVRDYMQRKVTQPSTHLLVTVRSTTDAARFAGLGQARTNSSAPPATASASHGPRRYTVQAGDTLADISANFFGNYDCVQLIRAANPGLEPTDLKPGTVIVIPAKPKP